MQNICLHIITARKKIILLNEYKLTFVQTKEIQIAFVSPSSPSRPNADSNSAFHYYKTF